MPQTLINQTFLQKVIDILLNDVKQEIQAHIIVSMHERCCGLGQSYLKRAYLARNTIRKPWPWIPLMGQRNFCHLGLGVLKVKWRLELGDFSTIKGEYYLVLWVHFTHHKQNLTTLTIPNTRFGIESFKNPRTTTTKIFKI